MTHLQWKIESPTGDLFLLASESGLAGLSWQRHKAPFLKSLTQSTPQVRILKRAIKQLEEYFAGKRKNFDIPLEPEGTPFQKRVWLELSSIPYGKTLSYGELAKKIKRPRAFRAVGTANGKNPFCIIVPCHRVIAANGKLGGFAGGLPVKIKLLKLERALP